MRLLPLELHRGETSHVALEVLQESDSLQKPRVSTERYPWTKAKATAKLAP
jgi:hypothetical protein